MKHTIRMLLSLALIGLSAGCSGDDGPSTPRSTVEIDGATAEQMMTSALSSITEIALAVPAFAVGDFSTWQSAAVAKSQPEPIWDPEQMAYVFDYTGPVMEMQPPSYWNISLALWVQYLGGGVPVQYPLGADRMTISYDVAMDMHVQEQDSLTDLDYDFQSALTIGSLAQADTYSIEGDGGFTVEFATVSPELSQSGNFAMDWSLDLTATVGGCPAGTVAMSGQGWSLAAVYDGAGNVSWDLTGPDYAGSGSETLPCQLAR